MSSPYDNHSDSKYPEDKVTNYPKAKAKMGKMAKKVNYTGGHKHQHNKRGLMGVIEGLQKTRTFGAKRRARHMAAKKAKLTGSKIPF